MPGLAGETTAAPPLPRAPLTAAPVALALPGCERFLSGLRARRRRLDIGRFPNGELHAAVPAEVAGRPCIVAGSISPPADNLARVTLAGSTLRRAGAARIVALLPYLAYARQDRSADNESLGLRWVGELLMAAGIEQVVCVDVHSPVAAEVLGLPVTSVDPATVLADALPASWRGDTTFVAPDEGARDRCGAVALAAGSRRPVVWARKRRAPGGVEHQGLVGVPGRRVVIVDDILDTGGTVVSCCRLLRAAGVRDIAVLVTHGLFTGDCGQALRAEGVRDVWVTDTVLSRRRPPDVRIVATAPLLADALESIV